MTNISCEEAGSSSSSVGLSTLLKPSVVLCDSSSDDELPQFLSVVKKPKIQVRQKN